ncbi:twin transmembrane helix small protein [Methylocapsa palsarum]|uniref:Hypoxia induced protein conserved region n=1 Tax=Methylocapsa palsarum TaxID=1612308 RepID=A0A1I4BHX3_9HYPH|nr:twin transmembrane helix small protein [Methylocapsa palsarum]SFK68472.1 Hypoxia induced protein conserved region [Methylocapsa palsarum]
MTNFGNLFVGLATGAVALVLVLGLINLLRGGSPDLSQKLMRWRIGLQLFAIIVIMGVLWFRART